MSAKEFTEIKFGKGIVFDIDEKLIQKILKEKYGISYHTLRPLVLDPKQWGPKGPCRMMISSEGMRCIGSCKSGKCNRQIKTFDTRNGQVLSIGCSCR